jgi:hypothetical protein
MAGLWKQPNMKSRNRSPAGFPSSQLTGEPRQLPVWHDSPVVQGSRPCTAWRVAY